MDAARIVSNHSAKRAVRVGRRIGPPSQTQRRRSLAQLIADNAGLYPRKTLLGVNFENVIQVPAPVHHDRCVAALAAQARPAATRKDWRTKIPANGNRSQNVRNLLTLFFLGVVVRDARPCRMR